MTEKEDALCIQAAVIRNMRRITEERKISVHQLLLLADVTVDDFENWLTGYTAFSESPVPRMARGLGISEQDLCAEIE